MNSGDIALFVAILGIIGTLGAALINKRVTSKSDESDSFRATITDLRASESALRDELDECEAARRKEANRVRRLEFLAHNLIRYCQDWEEAVELESLEIRRRIKGRLRVPKVDTSILDKD